MAIAQPLSKQSKSEFRVVYLDGTANRVRDRKINAKSGSEAISEVRKSNRPGVGNPKDIGFIKLPRAFDPQDQTSSDSYKQRLEQQVERSKQLKSQTMKVEQRKFDFQGYGSKKEYLKNKVLNVIGKGESEDEQISRLEKMNEYYKKNPHLIKKNLGRDESKSWMSRRLKSTKSNKYQKVSNRVESGFKKTGSKFRPGRIGKASIAAGAFIIGPGVPIPVVSQALGGTVAIGGNIAGAIYDKQKLKRIISKNPELGKDLDKKSLLKKKIKSDYKALVREKKYQKAIDKFHANQAKKLAKINKRYKK